MKALRTSWIAALVLGAVVGPSPARALQCLEPIRIDSTRPVDVALPRMRQHAARIVAHAETIFEGHVVAARHVVSEGPFEAVFLATFEVSRWIKGSGPARASFIVLPWCDGECPVPDLVHDLLSQTDKRIYFVGSEEISSSYRAMVGLADLRGPLVTCDFTFAKKPIQAKSDDRSVPFGQFLYDLAVASELEKLTPDTIRSYEVK